jgi:hypothetical protein
MQNIEETNTPSQTKEQTEIMQSRGEYGGELLMVEMVEARVCYSKQ